MNRHQQIDFDDRLLNFVSPEDLILLKLLANRPRDLGDVGDILFMQEELDEASVQHWAQQLDISGRLSTSLAQNE